MICRNAAESATNASTVWSTTSSAAAIGSVGSSASQGVGELGEDPRHHGADDVVAGADEVVHRRGRHAGERGDLLGRHHFGGSLTEQRDGGVENGVATFGLVEVAESGHPWSLAHGGRPAEDTVFARLDIPKKMEWTPNMRHDEQVRLIKQLCAHLDAGTNVDAGGLMRLPTTDYIDPVLAEQEWQEWFIGMPQCLGLSRDLPEPGSFLTNNDLGIPILATRDQDGTFRRS